MRLRFIAARYGPYAENVNHFLQSMEGHYLRGYGDRSAPVADASPIEVLADATVDAEAMLSDRPDTTARMGKVLELVQGFESPYELELLATVHWVAANVDQTARTTPEVAVKHVQSWSRRKKRLFT